MRGPGQFRVPGWVGAGRCPGPQSLPSLLSSTGRGGLGSVLRGATKVQVPALPCTPARALGQGPFLPEPQSALPDSTRGTRWGSGARAGRPIPLHCSGAPTVPGSSHEVQPWAQGPQGGADARAPGLLCSPGQGLWHVHPRTRNGPKCPGGPAPQRFLWPLPATHPGSPRPSGIPKPGAGALAVAQPYLLSLCSCRPVRCSPPTP